jgi:hypothetical protein
MGVGWVMHYKKKIADKTVTHLSKQEKTKETRVTNSMFSREELRKKSSIHCEILSMNITYLFPNK